MVKDSNRALGNYIAELSQFSTLLPSEEVALARRIKAGDKEAQRELIEANLSFVVSIAKKYQGKGIKLEDLIAEGNIGLIKAAKGFDETRGVKFITYAVWLIKQSIFQSLTNHSRMVRVPQNVLSEGTKMRKVAEELTNNNERQASVEEIAKQENKAPDAIAHILLVSLWHKSLDEPYSDSDSNSLLDTMPDEFFPEPDSELFNASLKEDLRLALATLTSRERSIIKMYFGIGQDCTMTLLEIGEKLNLSRERIRQIIEQAIRRLQHKSRSDNLRPYL